MRPRFTASSTTSWRRSRERVTLRSSASRKASTLLSARPAAALEEERVLALLRLLARPRLALAPLRFEVVRFAVVRFAVERRLPLRDPDREREPPDPVAITTPSIEVSRSRRPGREALSPGLSHYPLAVVQIIHASSRNVRARARGPRGVWRDRPPGPPAPGRARGSAAR